MPALFRIAMGCKSLDGAGIAGESTLDFDLHAMSRTYLTSSSPLVRFHPRITVKGLIPDIHRRCAVIMEGLVPYPHGRSTVTSELLITNLSRTRTPTVKGLITYPH